MKILYLTNPGNKASPIPKIVSNKDSGEVEIVESVERVSAAFIRDISPDLIIKDKYHFPVEDEVFTLGIDLLNFIPAFLPHNKGKNSNLWSFIDDTPKGGSIYLMRDNHQTMDLVKRFKVELKDDDTLKTSFDKIYSEIYRHFEIEWTKIKAGKITFLRLETGDGSYHTPEQTDPFMASLEQGYDTKVGDVRTLWESFNNKL